MYNFYATCASGVESVLADELTSLGIKVTRTSATGAYFTGDMKTCYLANMWIRTATRILLEVGRFATPTPEALYSGVRKVKWSDYFKVNQTFAVFASVRDSEITHSGFAALKVKDAIADSFRSLSGQRPNVDTADPDVRVFVRIFNNECVISIDTSGDSLHKRGYRMDKNEAPLTETLAAAILYLAGYNGNTVLCDFMCGSGTIAIEGALIAMNIAPGLLRKDFGFKRLSNFDDRGWLKIVEDAESRKKRKPAFPIYASDISKKTIEFAKSNARRAHVREAISISVSDFKDTVKPSESGIIVTNPPYGERLDAGQEEKLINLYQTIGDTLKTNYTGYEAYLLCGNLDLTKKIGLRAARRIVLFNGPIECRLLKYELYEGTRDKLPDYQIEEA